MGGPEEKEREKGTENLFEEIMAGNFPNLIGNINLQLQKAQHTPSSLQHKEIYI